ncbi:MAG: alpha-galactosidase [Akkermansiaceae bacterium]|nr:alpha-galactosidase [Armatimonadota bacterium]
MAVNNGLTLAQGASYIELADRLLVVGNEYFRRSWHVGADGLLSPESFRDAKTGAEWLTAAPARSGPTPATPLPEETRTVSLAAAVPALSVVEAESLTAELTATGKTASVVYTLQVFGGAGGVRLRMRVTGASSNVAVDSEVGVAGGPTGVEEDPSPRSAADTTATEQDILESLTLAPRHLRLTQVTLRDQTDDHNELVFEREWLLHPVERTLSLRGCLFYVEDVLSGAGLIFVKEAPLPDVRPAPSRFDMRVEAGGRRFSFVGHGAGETGDGYAFAVLTYGGGTAGRIGALQQYQRCLRPYVPGRDGMLVSNTWGDRNRDGRIRADFMAQEIEAGARLGVDVIQIDDGWQVGTTSNSVNARTAGGVWEGFYGARDNFWGVHPERFPDGLAPIVAAAREKGMRFGLWFGPDSADDFANWQRDADVILGLHRDHGIEYIKIDGVKLRSKVGERNLHAFFARVLTESAGRVVFDLDVTAETRPGYFGLVGGGPIFVENRYTDWHRYWPHQTLRNLWKLAHHVDPLRLRMEWLNHERHRDKYVGDPLAPDTYRPDYLFATVMFASPLGWFETASLPESYFAGAASLIATWKAHRDAIFSGTILPLGDAPDGVSWTGFVSVAADRRSAYVLAFREASPAAEWQAHLPLLSDVAQPVAATILGGDGSATVLPGRKIAVAIPDLQRFLFAKVSLIL